MTGIREEFIKKYIARDEQLTCLQREALVPQALEVVS